MTGVELLIALAAGAGLGAVVGLERQLGEGDHRTGARTFGLYGAWGVAAAHVGELFGGAAFAALAFGFVALVVASYLHAAPASGDYGTTTEAAQVATFVVGVLAHQSEWVVAMVLAIATAVVLGTKSTVHHFAGQLSDQDSRSFLQFAVVTGIVLPLVPDEAFGPHGMVNPREIWLMVVFVSAIGFAGYLGLRLAGRRSLGVTGILGGIASSTAVTLGLGRLSRSSESLRPALAAGIIGATSLMFPRVLVEAWLTAPELALRIAPAVVGLTVVTGVSAVWWLRRETADTEEDPVDVRNPLTLTVAVQFAALYGVIVAVGRVLAAEAPSGSLVVLGALSGLADVDAMTLTAGNLVSDGLAVEVGARAVLVAAATNTLVKVGLVWFLGTRALTRSIGFTLVPVAVLAAAVGYL